MEKKIEMTEREREIISIVNNKLNNGDQALNQETLSGVACILAIAWDTPNEVLHDLGIGKFKIALMFSKLGFRGFVSRCRQSTERDIFFSSALEFIA